MAVRTASARVRVQLPERISKELVQLAERRANEVREVERAEARETRKKLADRDERIRRQQLAVRARPEHVRKLEAIEKVTQRLAHSLRRNVVEVRALVVRAVEQGERQRSGR